MRTINIIVVSIKTEVVPSILAKLIKCKATKKILILDTPVVRLRDHVGLSMLSEFSTLFVAEDILTTNYILDVKKLIMQGKIGKLTHIWLQHSGYKHHAFALIRYLAGTNHIRSIHKAQLGNSEHNNIAIHLPHGIRATITEPRDYTVGRFLITGTKGSISDYELHTPDALVLRFLQNKGRYIGYKIYNNNNVFFTHKSKHPVQKEHTTLLHGIKTEALTTFFERIYNNETTPVYTYKDALYDRVLSLLTDKIGAFIDMPVIKTSAIRSLITLRLFTAGKVRYARL